MPTTRHPRPRDVYQLTLGDRPGHPAIVLEATGESAIVLIGGTSRDYPSLDRVEVRPGCHDGKVLGLSSVTYDLNPRSDLLVSLAPRPHTVDAGADCATPGVIVEGDIEKRR